MIDKVYVVTAGEYSDYHIERVFLDKSKAEKFCRWMSKWDHGSVEEYQVCDDVPYKPVYTIRVELSWDNTGKKHLHTAINTDINFDKNYKTYYYNPFNQQHQLTVFRSYENVSNFNEVTYTDRLVAYIYDLQAYVKSLIADGYDEKMIRETINNNSSV